MELHVSGLWAGEEKDCMPYSQVRNIQHWTSRQPPLEHLQGDPVEYRYECCFYRMTKTKRNIFICYEQNRLNKAKTQQQQKKRHFSRFIKILCIFFLCSFPLCNYLQFLLDTIAAGLVYVCGHLHDLALFRNLFANSKTYKKFFFWMCNLFSFFEY